MRCDVNESENWSCAMKYWDKNGSGLEYSFSPQHLSGNTEQVASGQDYSLFCDRCHFPTTPRREKCRWRSESDFLRKKQSNRISLWPSVALFLIGATKKPTRVCCFLLFTKVETKPFVCRPEEQRRMMPVCLMTTAPNLPHVASFMKYYG